MSTCNVDKWNMLAPTFDAFEIPKIGEDVYKRQFHDSSSNIL